MVTVPPIVRRFPTSVLLAASLVVFVASVLVFTLPFDVDRGGPASSTASCGPPIFEIGASDFASPSTIVPPGSTSPLGPLAQIPTSTSTTAAPGLSVPFGSQPPSTTVPGPTTTPSTLDPKLVQEACAGPASQRFLYGGLGVVTALLLGYLARLRRSHRFGYVVR